MQSVLVVSPWKSTQSIRTNRLRCGASSSSWSSLPTHNSQASHLGRQAFHRDTLRLAAWEVGAGWCSNCSAGHLCSSEEHHLAPPSTQVSPGLLNPSPTFSRRDTGRLWVTHTDPQSILMYIYCGYCGGSSTSSTLHLLSTSPPSSLSQVFQSSLVSQIPRWAPA